MLGLALGMMIALIQEALDNSVRSVAQLRGATGLDCLGVIPESPLLLCGPGGSRTRLSRAGAPNGYQMQVPLAFLAAALQPTSRIADAVQGVRVAAARQSARGRDVRVIGCVAADSNAGCSTFAANLAFALAADGERTVLVDWNAESPWLTQILSPEPRAGLQQFVAGDAGLAAVVQIDAQTGLSFIGQSPGGLAGVQSGPKKIQAILAELRDAYDVVVLDLPPLRHANTALQLSEWIDGLVLITRWGATPQAVLNDTLARPSGADAVFLGAVLNRSDQVRMQLYAADTMSQPVRRISQPMAATV